MKQNSKSSVNIKHSTRKKSDVKKVSAVTPWEDYLNTRTLTMQPANQAFRERLAEKLIEWSLKPTSYALERFINQEGISEMTYYRWLKVCELLQAAHDFALRQLGINREQLSIDRNLTMNHVAAFPLPQYLDRYDKSLRYREDIKKDVAQHTKEIVVMDRFPETDVVKYKKPKEIDGSMV